MGTRRSHLGLLSCGLILFCAQGAATAATDCDADDSDLEKTRAEQKIILVKRISSDSAPALRVAETGSQDAKKLLEKARAEVVDAESAFDLGCYERASTLAGAGLMTASAAFQSNSEASFAETNEYKNLRRRVSSLLDTAEKQDVELSGISAAEVAGINRQVARAEQLSSQGEHAQAIPLLVPIADRLERRLIDMFDKRTIFYSKEFTGPAEEYAYLVENYRGCRLLLDSQEAQGKESLADLLKIAEESFSDATAAASNSNWDDAIQAMQHAIEQCERASHIAKIY